MAMESIADRYRDDEWTGERRASCVAELGRGSSITNVAASESTEVGDFIITAGYRLDSLM